jgi:hypothetical protein
MTGGFKMMNQVIAKCGVDLAASIITQQRRIDKPPTRFPRPSDQRKSRSVNGMP